MGAGGRGFGLVGVEMSWRCGVKGEGVAWRVAWRVVVVLLAVELGAS
jgi:hypothetical protein